MVQPPSSTRGKQIARIDVSSYGSEPYCILSPFACQDSYNIPVPGKEELRSYSVEGIWQGLKIINEQLDLSLLKRKPHKRKGMVEGHAFGKEIVGVAEARKQVYTPAYVYHVINNGLDAIKEDLLSRLKKSEVVFYDVETNGDMNNLTQPYSHAALLTDLLEVLLPAPLPPFSSQHFQYLHQQVEAVLEYRQSLNQPKSFLLDEIITFGYLFSPDDLKATFALRAMKEGSLSDQGRLLRFSPTIKTRQPYEALTISNG